MPNKCADGWRLFIAWCKASQTSWKRVQMAAPTATMSQLVESQENQYAYQRTFTAYKDHLVTCPACLAAIRSVDCEGGK